MVSLVQSILDGDRRWGVMENARWRTFLRWLSDSGLLTTKVVGVTAVYSHELPLTADPI